MRFLIPEVKNRAMSRRLNACFVMFKYSHLCFSPFKTAVPFTKQALRLSEQVHEFFQAAVPGPQPKEATFVRNYIVPPEIFENFYSC